MKHADKAERIVYLWLEFADKNDKLDGIAGTSPSMMGAVSDFKGDIPRGSNFKPETVAARAEIQRTIPITQEERIARDAVMSLSVRSRLIVSIWPQLKKKENPDTGNLYTLKDVVKLLRTYGVFLPEVEGFMSELDAISKELVLIAEARGLRLEAVA